MPISPISQQELANLVSELTASQGLSIRSLAEAMDWDKTSVVRLFQGDRKLGVLEWIRLCEILGIDPAEGLKRLYTGE